MIQALLREIGKMLMEERIIGALLVILGVFIGSFLSRYNARIERKRKRKALASALLAELRWLENVLRQYAEIAGVPFSVILEHSVLDTALSDITLFDAKTTQQLAHFHGLLADLHGHLKKYSNDPGQVQHIRDHFFHFLRVKSAYVVRALPNLKKALEEEGGKLTDLIIEPIPKGKEVPELPPQVFPPVKVEEKSNHKKDA